MSHFVKSGGSLILAVAGSSQSSQSREEDWAVDDEVQGWKSISTIYVSQRSVGLEGIIRKSVTGAISVRVNTGVSGLARCRRSALIADCGETVGYNCTGCSY